MFILRLILCSALALSLVAFTATQSTAKRVALVIGISAYESVPILRNPKNDARDISKALAKLGFEVITGLDVDRQSFEQVVKRFARSLTGADLGLFFYAGHGLQVSGINYLMPREAKIGSEDDLDLEMIRLTTIQKIMERKTKTNIIFLDACRDNPIVRSLAKSMGTRSASVGQGLAQVEAGVGTLISYSTQPGNVAADGSGLNSPYTASLKKRILAQGEDLSRILLRVRKDVQIATAGRQITWDHHALTDLIYLSPRPRTSSNKTRPGKEKTIVRKRTPSTLPSWEWVLEGSSLPPAPPKRNYLGVDASDVTKTYIKQAKKNGTKPWCYVSIGTAEPWRDDFGDLRRLDAAERQARREGLFGGAVEGYEEERWLNPRKIRLLAPFMRKRFAVCRSMGFDLVEFDNMDGFVNETGFSVSTTDQEAYVRHLAAIAKEVGLAPIQKNAVNLVARLQSEFFGLLMEDCFLWNFCDIASHYVTANKPVFNAEIIDSYKDKGQSMETAEICRRSRQLGISTIFKTSEIAFGGDSCQN